MRNKEKKRNQSNRLCDPPFFVKYKGPQKNKEWAKFE